MKTERIQNDAAWGHAAYNRNPASDAARNWHPAPVGRVPPRGRADCGVSRNARSYWPVGIIAAFILFITGTVGLVVLACSQRMDLVSSDYYEQEIQFQNRIDQLARAQSLKSNASISYDVETGDLRIALPADQARAGVTGSIQLYRPSEARLDRQFKLELDQTGCQRLPGSGLAPGLWKIRVSWSAGTQQYLIDESVVVRGAGKTSRRVGL